ncbi:MAG TPA: response regulator [Bacillota bacterium]|nr:response regulator [Bacillota bacterium]HRS20665.1 response regulator [Clostridia bacterium]HQE66926.1 response regulator [Bacillota bacterium]HQI16741.1 response regulator [Bacillota bacterium]HQJ37422.1 response regulator [Bacillota bacterium]
MLQIMIVDDMDIVRRELKRLKLWGDKTGFVISDEACNGHEALEKLERSKFDMVITDIRMPKVDGIELLKEIAERKLCPCVVLLSDYSDFVYARQGLVLGAFDYITKPVAEEELEKLLQRAKEYISGKRIEEQRIIQLEQKLVEKVDVFFPQSEVSQLIDAIKAGHTKTVENAGNIFEIVYINLNHDLIKVKSLLNSIMLEITNKLSASCKWLDKYADINAIRAIDFSGANDPDSIKNRFVSAIGRISGLIARLKHGTEDNGIISQVCSYVLENIDRNISLSAVSDSLFMNKSYISEVFKQKTGLSFIEYLTIVKMERAKKLVGDGRLKTYEVAELLGFKDIEYFSRLFKKYTCLTPNEYRQGMAGENQKYPKNFGV